MGNPHTLLIEPGYLNIAVEGFPILVGLDSYPVFVCLIHKIPVEGFPVFVF